MAMIKIDSVSFLYLEQQRRQSERSFDISGKKDERREKENEPWQNNDKWHVDKAEDADDDEEKKMHCIPVSYL